MQFLFHGRPNQEELCILTIRSLDLRLDRTNVRDGLIEGQLNYH
jgi:hypothetical protein